MKKFILALGLVAVLSTTMVSCSTDDSAIESQATDLGYDNGDRDLPKPPMRP